MKSSNILLFIIISTLVLSSCKRDDDEPDDPHNHNEEELITTVELHLHAIDGTHASANWSDVDGPRGEDPIIDTLVLDTNKTYSLHIEFLDESGDEVHDLTHEIEEEGSEHIVCYDETIDELSITRTDSDGVYEIGLTSDWVTSNASSGTVTISVKHQPDLKDGTCAPGETDVEVIFPIVIGAG